MTRDELIERLKKSIAGKGKPESGYGEGWIDGMNVALRHVEKLDSLPAMTWQDEPSEPGWYYVESRRDGEVPMKVERFDGTWASLSSVWQPLNGRRVCPIPAPPALPKQGDA